MVDLTMDCAKYGGGGLMCGRFDREGGGGGFVGMFVDAWWWMKN